MDLRNATIVGDESLVCSFEVVEPAETGEYDAHYDTDYDEKGNEYFDPSLKNIPGKYELFIADNGSANCTIYYTAYVRKESDAHRYIPVIREWMKVLYEADHNWYFELKDIDHKDEYYFTLDSGDINFKSSEDWDDELIYAYIVSNLHEEDWFAS